MDCVHNSQIFHAAAKPRTSVIESQSHRLYGYGNAVIGGDIAQMVERVLCMHKVRGSIPCVSIFCFLRLYAHYVSPHLFLFRASPRPQPVSANGAGTHAQLAMAAGPKSQYAHLANLAVAVRARPNRACPPSFSLSRRDRPGAASRRSSHLSPPRLASQCSSWRRCAPRTASGRGLARARWEERGAPDSFWTVTRMKPRPSGRSGSAWGFLTWKGKAAGRDAHTESADAGDLEGARGGNRDARAGAGDAAEGRDADRGVGRVV